MERVWIYQANRILTVEERSFIQNSLAVFTADWKAHGQELLASVEIRYNLFIIIKVDQSQTMPTGCSIDKSVHILKNIEQELGLDLFDRMQIAYKVEQQVEVVDRMTFESLLSSGTVNKDTIVFNNLVDNGADLSDAWEVPLHKSWHAQVFR